MLKKSLFGVVLPGILLIAGCQSNQHALEKQNAEILAELQKMNQELSQIRKKISEESALSASAAKYVSGANSYPVSNGSNMALLAKVKKLPENPTDEAILKYIREIMLATAGQNSYSPMDPQVGMYRLIGKGHLKLLLPFLRSSALCSSYHLKEAMPELVEEKDKELIRSSIFLSPSLLDVVVKKGWSKEFKKEIFKILETLENNNSPYYTLNSVLPALVETPEDVDRLIEIYIKKPAAGTLLESLLMIPKVNLREITNKAWEHERHTASQAYHKQPKAVAAVRYGNNVSAAKYLLEQIIHSGPNQTYQNQDAKKVMMFKSDFPIFDTEKLGEWYRKNADRIIYDEKSGKFILKE